MRGHGSLGVYWLEFVISSDGVALSGMASGVATTCNSPLLGPIHAEDDDEGAINKSVALWISQLNLFEVLSNIKLGKQRYFAEKCRDRSAAAGEEVDAKALDKHIKLVALAERVTAPRVPSCDEETLRESLQALVQAEVGFPSVVKEALLKRRGDALIARVMEGQQGWLASEVTKPLLHTSSMRFPFRLVPRTTTRTSM